MGKDDDVKELRKNIDQLLAELKQKGIDIAELKDEVAGLQEKVNEDKKLQELYEEFKKSMTTPPPPCPEGEAWDDGQQKCVVIPSHHCPVGQVWNPATQKCESPPIGNGKDFDEEGIQKIYADDERPEMIPQRWFMSKSDMARLSGKGERKKLDGGVIQISPDPHTHPASARIYIRTTNPKGLDNDEQLKQAKDWKNMMSNPDADGKNRGGWMVDNFDFRDYEDTTYYKIVRSNDEDEFTKYGRGGGHPSGGFPGQCMSLCNKAQIRMRNLEPRAAKEYHHVNSPDGYGWSEDSTNKSKFNIKEEIGDSLVGKMIGQKLVQWNESDSNGNVVAVHIELYFDTASKDLPKPDLTKQNWRLWCEWIDKGDWRNRPGNEGYIDGCKAKRDQMITCGGPYVADRLDNNVWELHARSVRPIIPGQKVAQV